MMWKTIKGWFSRKPRYMNSDEIAKDFYKKMPFASRVEAGKFKESELIGLHHGTGRAIRNDYKLWAEDNPYTNAHDPMADNHPDQYSMEVIHKIWRMCQ